MISILCPLFITLVSAHFTLDYPNSTNTKNDLKNENIPPCGGFLPDLNGTLANFSVSGDWVQINTHHPEAVFRFRIATEDNHTWVDITPPVSEVGLGTFCIKTGPVPANLTGQKGVLQVAGNGADGALFEVHYPFTFDSSSVCASIVRQRNSRDSFFRPMLQ